MTVLFIGEPWKSRWATDSIYDTAAAEAMPGPGAKDARTLSEATHKASEQHGEAVKP
jgi:hypothetical protein